ncbi:MAG: DUF2391 domain-containing protein [Candidatus Nanohalobium sp.]
MSFLEPVEDKLSASYPFGGDDLLQQVVGSIILISPFVFTQEVWQTAGNMSRYNAMIALFFTFLIGHGVLYIAKRDRDWEKERKIFGVTWRYISLMLVAFGTVLLMIFISSARETFSAGLWQTFKVVSIISIFSVIGAAVTDSLI